MRLRKKTAEGERGWKPSGRGADSDGRLDREGGARDRVFERVLQSWKKRKMQREKNEGEANLLLSEGR